MRLPMQFYKTKQCIILPVLVTIITFTILSLPELENQYANSQSNETNSTANTTSTGVDLKDIHPSPLHLKSGSKFKIVATVVNDSPSKITFTAGVCDSPISAQFLNNVVIRYMQGCTTNSPPFELKPGEEVSVAGPSFLVRFIKHWRLDKQQRVPLCITRLRMDRPQTLHNLLYSQ